jgi:hypothetical protein
MGRVGLKGLDSFSKLELRIESICSLFCWVSLERREQKERPRNRASEKDPKWPDALFHPVGISVFPIRRASDLPFYILYILVSRPLSSSSTIGFQSPLSSYPPIGDVAWLIGFGRSYLPIVHVVAWLPIAENLKRQEISQKEMAGGRRDRHSNSNFARNSFKLRLETCTNDRVAM